MQVNGPTAAGFTQNQSRKKAVTVFYSQSLKKKVSVWLFNVNQTKKNNMVKHTFTTVTSYQDASLIMCCPAVNLFLFISSF